MLVIICRAWLIADSDIFCCTWACVVVVCRLLCSLYTYSTVAVRLLDAAIWSCVQETWHYTFAVLHTRKCFADCWHCKNKCNATVYKMSVANLCPRFLDADKYDLNSFAESHGLKNIEHFFTHDTQPFNGLWSGTTQVGRYQKKLTHSHPSWSSDTLYQLPPVTTIHSILLVQFTC